MHLFRTLLYEKPRQRTTARMPPPLVTLVLVGKLRPEMVLRGGIPLVLDVPPGNRLVPNHLQPFGGHNQCHIAKETLTISPFLG